MNEIIPVPKTWLEELVNLSKEPNGDREVIERMNMSLHLKHAQTFLDLYNSKCSQK